jgi:hypothetical protein
MGGRAVVRLILAIGSAAAAVWSVGLPTSAGGVGAYSYGGATSPTPAARVAATVALLDVRHVRNGHVAGWVGVGGPGLGPGGEDEWIQVGLTGFAGASTGTLYLEVQRGGFYRYRQLATGVTPGDRHRIAVYENASHPGWWRAAVDARPVTAAVFLPGSHGKWPGQVMAESWTERSGSCNGFVLSFDDIEVRAGGGSSPVRLAQTVGFADGAISVTRSQVSLTARGRCT